MALTPKQQSFVEEYVIDLNATQAAIRAGYSEKTAYSIGNENLSKPVITDAIAQIRTTIAKRNEITVDRIVEEYRRIALANTTDAIYIKDGHAYVEDTESLTEEQRAAISEIQETKDGIRIKFHSKTAALDALGKHLGMSSGNFDHRHAVSPELADIAAKISGVIGGE